MSGAGDITRLLREASAGDRQASSDLFEAVYLELRTIASSHRRRWNANETLNTTALINEAYLRLASHTMAGYQDRSHFFATASKAMRQILINYAERFAAAKRGGDRIRVTLAGLSIDDDRALEDLIHINALLTQLEDDNRAAAGFLNAVSLAA